MGKTRVHHRLLSYFLNVDTYGYGGVRPFTIRQHKSTSRGDSCNTFILNLPNHIGTHIDCPRHFSDSDKGPCDYGIEDFIFLRPELLDCPKSANEIVSKEDIKRNYRRLKRADILLLKTSFYKYRGTYRYSTENPGIAPEAARYIRRHLGNIRCIGIDAVSISPYSNRRMGRDTHRIFLSRAGFKGQPVFIIEDMNLSWNLDSLRKVFVAPLFIKDVDSSLCTVLGEFKERIK